MRKVNHVCTFVWRCACAPACVDECVRACAEFVHILFLMLYRLLVLLNIQRMYRSLVFRLINSKIPPLSLINAPIYMYINGRYEFEFKWFGKLSLPLPRLYLKTTKRFR